MGTGNLSSNDCRILLIPLKGGTNSGQYLMKYFSRHTKKVNNFINTISMRYIRKGSINKPKITHCNNRTQSALSRDKYVTLDDSEK